MEKLGNYLMQKGLKKRLGEENKRVIDKIKTETAVMKRVLSTVESYASERSRIYKPGL